MFKKLNKILIFTLVFSFSFSTVLAESQEKDLAVENRQSDEIAQLEMALNVAENKDLSEYTQSSQNQIITLIKKAKKVIEEKDYSQAESVKNDLLTAINNVKKDYLKKLNALLYEVDYIYSRSINYSLNLFSQESLKTLDVQRINAKTFLESSSLDQADAQRVYTALDNAYKKVVSNEAKSATQIRRELNNLINDTSTLKAFNYSEKTFNQFKESRNEAITIVADITSSKKMLLVSYHYLNNSYNNLEKLKIEEKVKLEKLIKDSQEISLEKYTKESAKDFQEKLAKAQKLVLEEIEDKDKKIEKTKEYSQMLEKLQTAKDNLKEIVEDNSSSDQKSNTNNSSNQNEIVNTGIEDNSDTFIAVIVASILLIIGLAYWKFRKDKR